MTEPPPFAWTPGIGDPSPMGWITVAVYLGVAYLAARAARADRHVPRRRAWWIFVAVAFVLLGVNKQLDLQSALTETGRWLAHRQGWYEERRRVQLLFLASLAATATVGLSAMLFLLRHHLRRLWLSALGMAATVVFVLARASSFNGMNWLIGTEPLPGVRTNWILELGAIALVGLGTLSGSGRSPALRPRRAPAAPPGR